MQMLHPRVGNGERQRKAGKESKNNDKLKIIYANQ